MGSTWEALGEFASALPNRSSEVAPLLPRKGVCTVAQVSGQTWNMSHELSLKMFKIIYLKQYHTISQYVQSYSKLSNYYYRFKRIDQAFTPSVPLKECEAAHASKSLASADLAVRAQVDGSGLRVYR